MNCILLFTHCTSYCFTFYKIFFPFSFQKTIVINPIATKAETSHCVTISILKWLHEKLFQRKYKSLENWHLLPCSSELTFTVYEFTFNKSYKRPTFVKFNFGNQTEGDMDFLQIKMIFQLRESQYSVKPQNW